LSPWQLLEFHLAGIHFLHCLVDRNMVGLRVWFCAQLTGLNSPAVLMLLTVPRGHHSVFLRCMSVVSYCFLRFSHFESLVAFSPTVSIFPFAPKFYLFPRVSCRVSCPLPLCPFTLWAYYSIIYFSFYFLISY
jgi:hypothetical protein